MYVAKINICIIMKCESNVIMCVWNIYIYAFRNNRKM